jgi:hypothetical protein
MNKFHAMDSVPYTEMRVPHPNDLSHITIPICESILEITKWVVRMKDEAQQIGIACVHLPIFHSYGNKRILMGT